MSIASGRHFGAFSVCVVLASASGSWGYSSGAGTCSYPNSGWSQMGAGQAGSGGFLIQVRDESGPVTHYSPGETYTVEISNSVAYAGFLLQSVKGMPGSPNVNGVGNFTWAETDMYHNGPCSTPVSSVTHHLVRTFPMTNRRLADAFSWTAPAAGTGAVTFHLVGVVTQYAWYGRQASLTQPLLEGSTPVHSQRWSEIKNLFR